MTRRAAAQCAVVAAAAAAALLPTPAHLVEAWFSTFLYPAWQRAATRVTNVVPFALFDLLLAGTAVVAAALLVRVVRRVRQRKGRVRALLQFVWAIVVSVAAVYLLFLLSWGLNYRRPHMRERIAASRVHPSTESVLTLGRESVRELNALYAPAHGAGWVADLRDSESLRASFEGVQGALSTSADTVPGRLKPTLLGPYFRWTGVDGMINPFGLEVLANPDLLPFERPFVAAHEWAHLAGFADEAEASFVGWLSCIGAGPAEQYSGWQFLYWQIRGELKPDERRGLDATLGEGPRRDLNAAVDRVRRGEWPLLRHAGWSVYDQYLKANRVEGGVRSYGEVLTLILQTRFDARRVPVRRSSAPSP